MQKQTVVYQGKSKTVYSTLHPEYLILEFRDDISAGNGSRVEKLSRKGEVNHQISWLIMQKLAAEGIPTQLERQLSTQELLVKKLRMFPIECVVRNRAAGSLCQRLAITEGTPLTPPLFELFLKQDALNDPMVNESYCTTFGWCTAAQYTQMHHLSLKINQIMQGHLQQVDLLLIDLKLEFGLFKDQIYLGDELSPDNCRIWDAQNKTKLDKDRFRQGLDHVVSAYEIIAKRLLKIS